MVDSDYDAAPSRSRRPEERAGSVAFSTAGDNDGEHQRKAVGNIFRIPSNQDPKLLHYLDGHHIIRHSHTPSISGGFCDIFTGDHPKYGKVAMRRPRITEKGYSSSEMMNFCAELSIWKDLQHPYILQFIGLIQSDGHIWAVSPFIENGALPPYLKKYPQTDRRSLVFQLADAIRYLHRRGVVHGDIKGSNILISPTATVLLCDFGLSKVSNTATNISLSGAASIRWCAPEVFFRSATKTCASDVYSFGMTVYEILSGNVPFHDSNDVGAMQAINKGNRPPRAPPTSESGDSYEPLWNIVSECWHKKPSARPEMVFVCERLGVPITFSSASSAEESSTVENMNLQSVTSPSSHVTKVGERRFDDTGFGRTVSHELSSHPRPRTPPLPRGDQVRLFFRGLFNMPVLISPGTVINIASLAAACSPIPGLQPCVVALGAIYDSVERVPYRRRTCRALGEKALRVVTLIKDNHAAEEVDQSKLQVAIDKAVITIDGIKVDVIIWSKQAVWTTWYNRREMEYRINTHEQGLKYCAELVQLATFLTMQSEVKKLQKIIESGRKDDPQYESAQRELEKLRTTSDAQGIARTPPELVCECEKTTTKAVITGSTYDVFKGVAWGHTPVALKYYRVFQAEGPDDRSFKRWERQIDIWRKLNHPHVLKLYGWCKIDGEIHLVSPWLEHGNVKTYLEAVAGELSDTDRIRLIREILLGLHYLHGQGNLHGALQPSNILIEDHGHAVLSDFNLSKQATAETFNTQSGAQTRTLLYSAPEISENQPIGKESDIYSWGMVTLEILSGQAPFYRHKASGPLMIAIVTNHERPKLEDHPCQLFDDYPDLWHLLASCWPREKSERPSVDHLLESLDEIAPVRQRPGVQRSL